MNVRLLGPDDFDAAQGVSLVALVLGGFDSAEAREARRRFWMDGRSHGAEVDGELVGHVRQFATDTLIPGGARLATAGITSVGVLPTHRRRGVLSALMDVQLADIARRRVPLASLRASEAAIYGRYGYGVAGQYASYELARSGAGFAAPLPPLPGRLRLVPPAEAGAVIRTAYDAARVRVGSIARPDMVWSWRTANIETAGKTIWCAAHDNSNGTPDGYVVYEATDRNHWRDNGNTMQIVELFGATAEVERALWRFVLDVDLAGRFVLPDRPLDEPLRWLLADPRALRTTSVNDEQWLRLIDVKSCLAARSYNPVAASVALAVSDDRLPANAATYVVSATGAVRRKAAPQLSVDVATLGAAYLGGTSWAELAAAGRVVEHKAGAVAAADALFATRPLPWCGTFF